MNNLAQRLYDLRAQTNLKQEELAEALGVSRQAVSKWEMGTGVPSLENLKAISDFFGVTIDSLVKDSPTTTESKQISAIVRREDSARTYISPVEKDPFLKRVANSSAVFLGFLIVILLSSVTTILVSSIMQIVIKDSNAMYRAIPIAEIVIYIVSTLYAVPFLYLAALMIDKNMSVFSKALYIRPTAEKRRVILIKVLAAFAVHLIMPAATNILEIVFWKAGMRSIWSSSCMIGALSVIIETFIIYAIISKGCRSLFRSKLNLFAAIAVSGLFTIAEILGSYSRMRLQPAFFTATDITYPRINDFFDFIYTAFILMTVALCHTRSTFVKEEPENEQSASAAL